MSDYGVLSTGFNRKRLDLLLEELNAEVQAIFGENFNVSPESPDGQVNGTISESNANLWEIAEEAYNAFNPSAVEDITQDNLYELNGLERLLATASTVSLTVTGTSGTLIETGSLIATSDTADEFSTDEDVTIPIGGSITVSASSVNTGPISALSGTLTVINTPVTGWATVTNLSNALEGTNKESNVEFRARRERSVARDAQAIIDAIFAEVRSVSGVTQAVVLENDTDSGPDANGLPAHSINAIVVGGADADIAEAIFLKKTLGATPFGTTTVVVKDNQDNDHSISFSRPTVIPIFVEVNLTTFSGYPVDGDAQIAQAIIDYAEGNLVETRGFSLGDNVIHSEIYTPVNTIPGHTVDSLYIKLTDPPTGSTADITIAVNEASQFLLVNIVVNS